MPSSSTSPKLELPEAFPWGTPPSAFVLGARVAWQPFPAEDFGIITGLEYAPAPHLDGWGWRYKVLLNPRSPSAGWITSDMAWEDDLMPLPSELPEASLEAPQP